MSTDIEQSLGFPRERTALLVINPTNDFLSETGAGWDLFKGTVQGNHVLENLQKAVAGARERGLRVVFGSIAFTEEDYQGEGLQRRSALSRILFERRIGLAGTWGADFHPSLRPTEQDLLLQRSKGPNLFAQDQTWLGNLGVTHLVICGVPGIACLATGLRAVESGRDVTFLSDAIASESTASQDALIHVQLPLVGNGLMKVDDFLNASADEQRFDEIAKGDRVFSSDQEDLGRIEEIVMPTNDIEPYLRVSGGLLGKDFFVPLDAIVRRMGPYVYINVPKSMVGQLKWEDAPTRNGRRAKFGFPEAKVKPLGETQSGPTVL